MAGRSLRSDGGRPQSDFLGFFAPTGLAGPIGERLNLSSFRFFVSRSAARLWPCAVGPERLQAAIDAERIEEQEGDHNKLSMLLM